MIDETELMIMDWVLLDGKPTQVIAVGVDHSITVLDGRRVSRKKVSPMPITTKMLLENGFREVYHRDAEGGWLSYKLEFKSEERFDGNGRCLFPKYIELSKTDDEWWLHSEYGKKNMLLTLKYVHSLKHIMLDIDIYQSIIIKQ